MGKATKPRRAGKRTTTDEPPLAPPWRNWESSWADIRARRIPIAVAALEELAGRVERHRRPHRERPQLIQPDPIGQWYLCATEALDALHAITEPLTIEATIRLGERERDRLAEHGGMVWDGWAAFPDRRAQVIECAEQLRACSPSERWVHTPPPEWFPLYRLGAQELQRRSFAHREGVVRWVMDPEAARVWSEANGATRLCVRCSEVSDATRPSTPARDQLADYVEVDMADRLRACAGALIRGGGEGAISTDAPRADPTLSKVELDVLEALFRAKPVGKKKVEIAGAAGYNQKTITKWLDSLVEKQLVVDPPPGKRGGYALTTKGNDLARTLFGR